MADAGYYLDSFLAPLAPVLARSDVTDIFINRTQEAFVEQLGGRIERLEIPALTERALARLARQIAASTAQGISRESPLLAATLPDRSRIQIAAPPVTRSGHVMAIRKHVSAEMSLADWAAGDAFEGLEAGRRELDITPEFQSIGGREAETVLRAMVRSRRNILIAGGTSSGKTTFLNALLAEIPQDERLVLIEDTEELRLTHPNAAGLLAARSKLSEAQVSAEELLIAALRMRPDRIILGELRGSEAFTFLRAVNTGHPGSITTIHADSPERAIEQLALLVLQSGARLGRDEVRDYVRMSIDAFVQLERRGGKRRVTSVVVKDCQQL